MSRLVNCPNHGSQNEAFVCRHLLETLEDDVPRGVLWSKDKDGAYNAYCQRCDNLLEEGGGEWTDELGRKAGVTLICEGCMMKIFAINGVDEVQ